MSSFLRLLTVLFLTVFSYQAMATAPVCGQLFKVQTTVNERLKNLEHKFHTAFEIVLNEKARYDDHIQYKIRLKHADEGYTIGYVLFNYHPTTHLLDIASMDVMTDFKRSGVGEVLMDQALQRFETKIIAVESLASDNNQVLQDALAQGLSKTEALRQTPAYKIRQKLGFTEIIPGSINKNFGFQVRRP